jgi:hypothetical protein
LTRGKVGPRSLRSTSSTGARSSASSCDFLELRDRKLIEAERASVARLRSDAKAALAKLR